MSDADHHDPDRGTCALMFTDIEGHVKLWQRLGGAFADVLAVHNRLVRSAAADHGGTEVKFLGDGFLFRFDRASQAVIAAVLLQEQIAQADWPAGLDDLLVRIAVHAGEVRFVEGDCLGPTVNVTARMLDVAFGGQVIVSEAAVQVGGHELLGHVTLADLGARQLRDVDRPTRLFLALPPGAAPPETVALRAPDVLPTNLPRPLDDFVGREHVLADIDDLLSRRHVRFVTLTGPGGVGKTRLLQHIGAARVGRYEDGAWLVPLDLISDSARVPFAVAAALRLPIDASCPDPVAALAQALSAKSLLLLLDNYEQLMDAATVPSRLLEAAPGVTCIVTSREPLHVRGEWVVALPPLELPDPTQTVWRQRESESVDLFCRRAARARGGGELAPSDFGLVARICRRLGGLPLALELAAAQLSHLTLTELWESLDQGLDALDSEIRDAPARLSSVRAAIDWSYDMLPGPEARTFTEVGVFRGGFGAEAARAVCTEPVVSGLLHRLHDRSLLQSDMSLERARYSLLPPLREYALERLGDRADGCRARAARYFAALTKPLDLKGHQQAEHLHILLVELENIRATLEWADEGGHDRILTDVTRSVWPVFQFFGAAEEAVRWLQAAVGACRRLGDEESLAQLLVREGVAHKWARDYASTQRRVDESLEISERLCLHENRILCLLEHANLRAEAGEASEAREGFQACLTEYEAAGNVWGVVECLRGLGRLARRLGAYQEAEQWFGAALAREDAEDQPWGVTNTLFELGRAQLARGDLVRALESLRESVRLCRQVGDRAGLVDRLQELASGLRRAGQAAEAEVASREALALARRYAPHMVESLAQPPPA